MRLATFNLENLFRRPAVMSLDDEKVSSGVLTDVEKLNALLAEDPYTEQNKARIKAILEKYKSGAMARKGWFDVNEARWRLYKGTGKKIEIVATGRGSWVGWVELKAKSVDPRATTFTGRVIKEVNADIMCTVEVEDRITLDRFNSQVLGSKQLNGSYPFVMCLDGNDARGIDVGIVSRLPVVDLRTHIFDTDGQGTIFSRDCAEYEFALPGNQTLCLLANHFKSKRSGGPGSDAKRKRQATRTAEIYQAARKRTDYVAVLGDLNDFPASPSMDPLVKQTDLRDVSTHPTWQGDPGTYGTGKSKSSKIDYILLSPALWARVKQTGIERRGVYAPSLKIMWKGVNKVTAASDHAALWVDLNL